MAAEQDVKFHQQPQSDSPDAQQTPGIEYMIMYDWKQLFYRRKSRESGEWCSPECPLGVNPGQGCDQAGQDGVRFTSIFFRSEERQPFGLRANHKLQEARANVEKGNEF